MIYPTIHKNQGNGEKRSWLFMKASDNWGALQGKNTPRSLHTDPYVRVGQKGEKLP